MEPDEMSPEELEAESQLVINASLTMVVTALIQTHPNYASFQLALTNVLEGQLPNGALGKLLSPTGRTMARQMVETLAGIQQQTAAGHQSAAVLQKAMKPR